MNNAGIAQIGSSVESSLDVDQFVMNINVLGTISLTKAVLPHMVRNKSGQIVVISSASGKCGKFKSIINLCGNFFSLFFFNVHDFLKLKESFEIITDLPPLPAQVK